MTSTVLAPAPLSRARPARLSRTVRFELVKQLAQWRVRVLLLTCWLLPALLVGVLSRQSALPTDTVFGRWMATSGWAGSLVVLAFCCSWVLPLLTSLVAGDVFAVEDRLGTWGHLLVATRSAGRVFVAKALASLAVVLALVAGLAVSSVVGGLAASGDLPLVGLDGQLLAPGCAARLVALAWLVVVVPTLAFAAVGLLGSVTLGRSPTGLLVPALLALLLQVAQLLPLPLAVRVSLPGYALLTWRGLFGEPVQVTPLVVGVVVGLVWTVAAAALAFALFVRRDFTGQASDGLGPRVLVQAALPLVLLGAATAGVVAAVLPAVRSAPASDAPRLERSLATAFGHLYRLQSRELARPDVTEAQLASSASCDKGGSRVEDRGPGNDWRCVVSWHLPGATATGSAVYQLELSADGRYVVDGDGPQAVNGSFQVRRQHGVGPNPLWQFDGSLDLLAPPS
ncbi:MAG: transporter permease [Frankiales bacterium]|nr:transporter permease [Frankiales bacterium]